MNTRVAFVSVSLLIGLCVLGFRQWDRLAGAPLLIVALILAAMGVAAMCGICLAHRQKNVRSADAPSPAPEAAATAQARRHPLYRLVRIAVFLLSAGLLAVSVSGIARSLDVILHAGALRLPASDQAFEKTVMAQVVKATATLDFDSIILEALAEEDIDRAEIYVSAARRIGFSLRPETEKRFADATDTWSSALRALKDCGGSVATGDVHDLAGFACGVASDISGWGDLRDIAIHGSAYLGGKSYDPLILGLSVFGLGITFLEPSQTLNTGAAVLKGASRLRRASQPLQRQLRHMVGETVDLGAARTVLRNPSAESAAKLIRRQGMGELGRAASHAGTIYSAGGGRALVMALRHADNVDELSLFARLSRSLGKQADEVIEIAGKHLKVVFRAHKVTLRTAAAVTGWTTALAAALLALLTSLSEAVARRIGTHQLLAWLAATLARRQATAPEIENRYNGTPV